MSAYRFPLLAVGNPSVNIITTLFEFGFWLLIGPWITVWPWMNPASVFVPPPADMPLIVLVTVVKFVDKFRSVLAWFWFPSPHVLVGPLKLTTETLDPGIPFGPRTLPAKLIAACFA